MSISSSPKMRFGRYQLWSEFGDGTIKSDPRGSAAVSAGPAEREETGHDIPEELLQQTFF